MRKIFLLAVFVLAAACTSKVAEPVLLNPDDFKGEVDGDEVALYTLKGGDLTLQVTNYGARVASIWTPDRDGNYADVAVGRKSLEAYMNPPG